MWQSRWPPTPSVPSRRDAAPHQHIGGSDRLSSASTVFGLFSAERQWSAVPPSTPLLLIIAFAPVNHHNISVYIGQQLPRIRAGADASEFNDCQPFVQRASSGWHKTSI
jgi:hypothetical protein